MYVITQVKRFRSFGRAEYNDEPVLPLILPLCDLSDRKRIHESSLGLASEHVKVAYYSTSVSRFFSKLCSKFCSFLKIILLFPKIHF